MQHIGNLWENIKHLLVSQYENAEKLQKLLGININAFQSIEDVANTICNILDVNEATGAILDYIGKLRGNPRKQGEPDDDYRARLLVAFKIKNAGTPDNVIENARDISKDNSPQYIDEVAATWFVYTPNGKQLHAQQAKTLTPAGVLGLVGAGILQGDGSLLADAEGNVILMVADDYDEHETNGILTEFGENILTETGDTLETEGA